METPINSFEAMSEDQVLAYTQSKRRAIVEEITKEGAIPKDRSEATLLIQALDGMDRSALTQKRIKADEKASDAMAGSAAIVAKLLNSIGSTRPADTVDVVARETPTLGDDIPDPVLVPGETTINPPQLDYDTFMSGFQSISNPSSESS